MDSTNHDIQQRIAQGVNAWERDAFQEALEIFDGVLEERGTFPDVHNKRGLCLALLGRLDEALEAFERAVELAPAYAEAHVNRGIILRDMGRAEAAQAAFHVAEGLHARDGSGCPAPVGNQIAVAHAKLGELYLAANRTETAVEQYRAALRVRPGYLDIRTKLAEALLQVGDLAAARREFEVVLDQDPRFTQARLRLGIVLHRMGQPEAAAACWERCLAEEPDDFRARAYLASLRPAR